MVVLCAEFWMQFPWSSPWSTGVPHQWSITLIFHSDYGRCYLGSV